jgi:hypothetical protein
LSGNYSETVTVDVSGLTLEGPNAGTPGDGSRNTEAAVNGQFIIDANGVMVDGFKVNPSDPGGDTTKSEAIRINGGIDNAIIQNNIVEDFARTSGSGFFGVDGINLFGGDGSDSLKNPTVRDNLVQGLQNSVSGGAAGISVQGNVEGAVVTENVIKDIGQQQTPYGFGVVVRGTGNHSVTPTDVTITSNDTSDVLSDPSSQFFGVGFGVEASGGSEITANGNNISNTELLLEDKTATLSLDNFASNNPLDRGALLKNVDVDGDTRNIIYNSIQDAESAAAANDEVKVLSGTYDEKLTVNKALKLKGANAGTVGTGSRNPESIIKQGVDIRAGNVLLDGFKVTNDDVNGVKISLAVDDVQIKNNIVTGVSGGTAGDKGVGNGINLQFTESFEETSEDIAIKKNKITNINTPSVRGDSADAIGVQLLPRGNDVNNLKITGNQISDIEPGTANDRSEARGVSIATQFSDKSGGDGDGYGDSGQPLNLQIKGNTITGLTADFARAITLFEDKAGPDGSESDGPAIGPKNFKIKENTIEQIESEKDKFFDEALFVGGYENFGDSHEVKFNNLLSNVESIGSADKDALNAKKNWWGDSSGPQEFELVNGTTSSTGNNGSGTGAFENDGDITVRPWLCDRFEKGESIPKTTTDGNCEADKPQGDNTLRVCKLVVDSDGAIFDGANTNSDFSITINSATSPDADDGYATTSDFATTTTFTTPTSPNNDFFDADNPNGDSAADVQCKTINNLPDGNYAYGQENINPDGQWESAQYNDGSNGTPSGLNDFANYSGELFNEDPGDDGNRDYKSDGDIPLSDGETRTLTIKNTYTEPAPEEPREDTGAVSITKYSCDPDTQINADGVTDGNAKPDKCSPQSGVKFSATFEDKAENGGFNGTPGTTTVSATTSQSGTVTIDGLSTDGRYLFQELKDNGEPQSKDNILHFACEDDTGGKKDNKEIAFIESGQTDECVIYNKKDPTQKPVCEPNENLLNNAGFENPNVNTNANWDIFDSGTSSLVWNANWLNPSNAPDVAHVELHRGVQGWNPSEGEQHTELDSDFDGPGSPSGEPASVEIYQDVPTTQGEEYSVAYDFSPRPGTDTSQNKLEVLANGNIVDTVSADGTGTTSTDWTSHTTSFTATASSTTITFRDAGQPNAEGTLLDNTSLTCVPDEEERTGSIHGEKKV